MKTELEPQDVEAISQRVLELLAPIIAKASTGKEPDTILDVEGLAGYLKVDPSWIYKQVQLKAIPYIKTGKYIRFRKSAIDKYLERNTVRAAC